MHCACAQGVEYRLVYSLGTSAFTSASSITITLGSLATAAVAPTRLLQRFSVRFVPSEVDTNPITNRVRSGNPGYLIGQPLLAGRLANDSNNSSLKVRWPAFTFNFIFTSVGFPVLDSTTAFS